MPVPAPKSGEKQNDFISRCMSNDEMQSKFPDQEQRVAVCFTKWRENKSKEKTKIKSKIKKLEKAINNLIRTLEFQEIKNNFTNEIPIEILKEFSEHGQILFKSIYLKNRLANTEIQESLQIAKSFTQREDKAKTIRLFVLKEMQKELSTIKYGKW